LVHHTHIKDKEYKGQLSFLLNVTTIGTTFVEKQLNVFIHENEATANNRKYHNYLT